MTRVLFLTESFHPVLGGGEQHVRTLAGRLAAGGMPATVLTRHTDPASPAEELDGAVRVLRVGPSGPGRRGKYLMVAPALARLRRERRAHDLLVVRGTRVLGLPGLVLGRIQRKPVVLQAEVNGELSGEVYTWGTALERAPLRALVAGGVAARNQLLRDADAFVAMSRLIRDEFLAAGVAEERVALIPHGVDTERFRPAAPAEREELRRRLGLPADGLLVTYSGRLLRGKGIEDLLEAFGAVAAREPRARLLLVGSGGGQALSVEAQLEDAVRRAGLAPLVTFTGRVENVEDYLRASDLFAFPSRFEALGLALIEASACGLPCVGSRTGGIVDVVEEGGSGLLVPPGDPSALAGALAGLLADPPRRTALGARGRRIVLERFELGRSVDRYRALFLELCPSG